MVRIAYILGKHNALFVLDALRLPRGLVMVSNLCFRRVARGTEGQRLSRALQELGPTFIKLGQALSVRADIIGEPLALELRQLQDSLPPFPAAQAKAIITAELGEPIEALFTSFEDEPVAAASIAQVHFAVTAKGQEVAVKVMRPDIIPRFQRDINLLYFIARWTTRTLPKYKRLRLTEVVDDFARTVRIELDMRMEAAAASELAENMAGDAWIHVPAIHWDMTSQSVLTLERIQGIRVDDVKGLKQADHAPEVILEHAAEIFFYQVFRDGYFHADMHPGNVFIGKEGTIQVVDFGIMGRLDHTTRIFLAEMLLGFLNRDYAKVAQVHFDAAYIPPHQDKARFTQAMRAIGEPIFGKNQEDISLATLLQLLFNVTETFEMETQPQLILLQKTMLFAEGMARQLNPAVNFWELSRPLMEDWCRRNLGAKARVEATLEDMQTTLCSLRHLRHCITPDGLKLHPDTVAAMRNRRG